MVKRWSYYFIDCLFSLFCPSDNVAKISYLLWSSSADKVFVFMGYGF